MMFCSAASLLRCLPAVPQSDLLWASLVKELYKAVEDQLGKEMVRKHRASIALSNELPSDSPETKRHCGWAATGVFSPANRHSRWKFGCPKSHKLQSPWLHRSPMISRGPQLPHFAPWAGNL